jgi:hypothetical protein
MNHGSKALKSMKVPLFYRMIGPATDPEVTCCPQMAVVAQFEVFIQVIPKIRRTSAPPKILRKLRMTFVDLRGISKLSHYRKWLISLTLLNAARRVLIAAESVLCPVKPANS